MEPISQETYTAGGIALALLAAIITIIKIHDKQIEKTLVDHQLEIQRILDSHKTESKELRSEAAAQTLVVIDTLKNTAVANEQLAHSIDELKQQGKENTDKLSAAFYAVLTQKKE